MIKKSTVFMFMFVIVAALCLAQDESMGKTKLDAKTCNKKCLESMKTKDFNNAIKFGEKAIELDGKNSDYHYQLGRAYQLKISQKDTSMMEKLDYANKMLKVLKKSVELDGSNLKARKDFMEYYLNAPPVVGGNLEKAEEQVKIIIKNDELFGYTAYAKIFIKRKFFIKAKDMAVKALSYHRAFKQKTPEKRSSFDVTILNYIGYGLYNSGKKKDAIEVFKMNIVAFPKNYNTYDSLGETYMNTGETKLAIKNYEIALRLNPNKTKFEKQIYQNQVKYLKKMKSGK